MLVDVNIAFIPPFMERVFKGKLMKVALANIAKKLEEYVVNNGRESIDQFCRLYSNFVLNTCWLYPRTVMCILIVLVNFL